MMTKHQLTVFVGDTDASLMINAKNHDSSAFLVDHNNYKTFLTEKLEKSTTIGTSLGDMQNRAEIFYRILELATEIIYVPPAIWSDGKTIDPVDPTSCIQGLTENLLLQISDRVSVQNLSALYFVTDIVPLVDHRKSDLSQIWVSGCSFSYGVGVDESQRYGQLLADELSLPVSFLAQEGGSIKWAANQILRSDVRARDIVIWGITTTERTHFIHNNKLYHIHPRLYSKNSNLNSIFPLKSLYEQDNLYASIYSIEQVINFCKKCQANLIMIGLITGNNLFRYLKSKNNYFDYPYQLKFSSNEISKFNFYDLGSDNCHPGPIQHQAYKNFILKVINQPNCF